MKKSKIMGNKIAISEKITPLAAKRLRRKSPLQTTSVIKAKEEAMSAILK